MPPYQRYIYRYDCINRIMGLLQKRLTADPFSKSFDIPRLHAGAQGLLHVEFYCGRVTRKSFYRLLQTGSNHLPGRKHCCR